MILKRFKCYYSDLLKFNFYFCILIFKIFQYGTIVSNVVYLTTEEFKSKVFNYTVNKEWKYSGELPAIIDFYADWCGPCKMVAPILQEIAKDYQGKLIVYKVDTENERVLSR